MPHVTARIKVKGKPFEISVDLDEALKVKAGKGDIMSALQGRNIFVDLKKGNVASAKDLTECFATTDVYAIATQIITKGEVQKTQEFRDAAREAQIKQLVDLIVRNAIDQNGRPYTADRITRGLEEVHYNIDNRPADQQLHDALHKLKEILPIKVDVKRVKLTIPARFTGQVYGLVKDIKESEEWLGNGDLEVIANIPSGMQLDFYDKLNSFTHGAARSEELSDKK
ncbi:MAG TPA: ribosome assembly factor SBDS [Candidatus Nanoarchaeia archaeon]|nr:ribosome assembly factor SBDS [Candidatus Nanoarchaeia archaeon]